MPEARIEVEVWCERCGKGLCGISSGRRGGVDVGFCPDCEQEIRAEEYQRGFEEGYENAKEEMEE